MNLSKGFYSYQSAFNSCFFPLNGFNLIGSKQGAAAIVGTVDRLWLLLLLLYWEGAGGPTKREHMSWTAFPPGTNGFEKKHGHNTSLLD